MFSASELTSLLKLVGTAKPASYAEAHGLYPTVSKLMELKDAVSKGGVIKVLTDLESQAVDAARAAPPISQTQGPQPPPGALEASRT